MEITLLKTFLAIVDYGNFLSASEAIGRSPAAISVQIRKLEDSLDCSLFTRDARGTVLTPHGERLLPMARRMLSVEAEIFAYFGQAPVQGEVLLGVPDDVVERFPMGVLKAFTNEYPNVKLGIRVDHTPALLKFVDSGVLDLSIITYAESIAGVTKTERLTRESEIWAMAANGTAAEKTPLPITLWDKGWAWHEPAVELLQNAGIDYSIVLECENITGRKAAIAADLAVGPVPVSQMDESLKPVPGLQTLPPLPEYGLGLKTGKSPSQAVTAVAQHLRSYFSRNT